MLYTTYLSKLNKISEDAEKIIITRFPPKWLKTEKTEDEDILKVLGYKNAIVNKKLSPLSKILLKYKEDNDWDEYVRSFNLQMNSGKTQEALNELLAKLKSMGNCNDKTKDIYLICFEKDYLYCHRYLIAQWMVDHGIEWKEF